MEILVSNIIMLAGVITGASIVYFGKKGSQGPAGPPGPMGPKGDKGGN